MKLEINPNNRKYYTDDFIKGFECGIERQYEEDNKHQLNGDLISRKEVLKEGAYYSNLPTHTFLKDVVKVLPAIPQTAIKHFGAMECPNCGAKMVESEEVG